MENISATSREPGRRPPADGRALRFYAGWIRRDGRELGRQRDLHDGRHRNADGTDVQPGIFRTFSPRYKRLIDAAHEGGMHSGSTRARRAARFLEDFIEIGLDVIHRSRSTRWTSARWRARFEGDGSLLGGHGRAADPAARDAGRRGGARCGS